MPRRFTQHDPKPARILRKAGRPAAPGTPAPPPAATQKPARPKEIGGPSGPEPTRYGDWERKGICVDF